MRDAIILGGGIAGASIAYQLHHRGLDTLLIEADAICSGGSAAAGAFLSPKISKPSPYKAYLNEALAFSLAFYQMHFPDLLHKEGLYKIPLDREDKIRCRGYEPYIDFPWTHAEDGYFFPEAGIVDPAALTHALLSGIDVVEKSPVDTIRHLDGYWILNETYRTKYLILATGTAPDLLPLPYLPRKKIGGYRYDVTFAGMQRLHGNRHKSVSVSTYLPHAQKVIVGATHIRGECDLNAAADADRYGLIDAAREIVSMEDLRIEGTYAGYRSFTYDYFPILGPVVDAAKTLERYPYLRSGTKVPPERFLYHPNLFMHAGLGSRGFVFAPFNAAVLCDQLLEARPIDSALLPATRFLKWARRIGIRQG